MTSFFNNEKGSALVGLMLTLVIIAALIYGGSFFWGDKDSNIGIPATIDKYSGAKDDLAGVQKNLDERNKIMNDLVGNDEKDIAPETDLAKWHVLEREDNNFKIKYPQGWYYTINHKDAQALDYDLIVGFGPTKEIWEQSPPYGVELIITDKENEWLPYDGIINDLGINGDNKIVLQSSSKSKELINKMAGTFELLNQTTDPSTSSGQAAESTKTYREDELGLELQYPGDFKLEEDISNGKLFENSEGHFWIFIENTAANNAEGIKKELDAAPGDGYPYKESYIDIGGVRSYKQGRYDLGVIEGYYIPLPGKQKKVRLAFEFNFGTKDENKSENIKDLINQIITTFKFTN